MYSDEHLEAKRMELFIYLTPSAECAEEKPCHSSGAIELEAGDSKYTDLIFDLC